jgi:hypothetical protein
MNENEFDHAARAWLDDGPTRMSDRALLSALEEIHSTRQRRALWPAWRATPVSIFARVATAAVLAVAVGLMAINVVQRQPDGSNVGGPSPSPSLPQALDFPDLTKTFVSPRNGFSVKHPDTAVLTPANVMDGWDPGDEQSNVGVDVVQTRLAAVFKGASIKAPDWEGSIDGFVDDISPGGCGATRSQQAEFTIDGQSGWIAECPNEIDAIVVAGGRLYLFTLLHARDDGPSPLRRLRRDGRPDAGDRGRHLRRPALGCRPQEHDDDLRLAELRLFVQVSRPGTGSTVH